MEFIKQSKQVSDLLNPLKSNIKRKALAMLCVSSALVHAQDAWQWQSSINTMNGRYVDSLTMNKQQSLGVRISGERNHQWGFTAGVQSTRIDMAPITQTSVQQQNNWLLSAYTHQTYATWPGRWTLQLDTHQLNNDASHTNTNAVRAVAPQITWLSHSLPLKADLSLATSNYKNTAPIQQLSSAIAYGINNGNDWLQIRGYVIQHLTPSEALGLSSTRAVETKITHFLDHSVMWMPTSLTAGLDRGKKIYWVDMASQAVNNQPMVNEGGENITAAWRLNTQTHLTLQLSQTRYYAESVAAHRFKLGSLSTQLAFAW